MQQRFASEINRPVPRALLLEVGNAGSPLCAYALISGDQPKSGFLEGVARSRRVDLKEYDRVTVSVRNLSALEVAADGRWHGRCYFLTVVAGANVKQVAIYGAEPSGSTAELIGELRPLVEGQRATGEE